MNIRICLLLSIILLPLFSMAQKNRISSKIGIANPQGTYKFKSGTQHEFTESGYTEPGLAFSLGFARMVSNYIGLSFDLNFVRNQVDEQKMASIFDGSNSQIVYSVESDPYRHLTALIGLRFEIFNDESTLRPYLIPQFGSLLTFKPELTITESSQRGTFKSTFDSRSLSTFGFGGEIGINYKLSDLIELNLSTSYIRGTQKWEVFEESSLSNSFALRTGGVIEREIIVELLTISAGVNLKF